MPGPRSYSPRRRELRLASATRNLRLPYSVLHMRAGGRFAPWGLGGSVKGADRARSCVRDHSHRWVLKFSGANETLAGLAFEEVVEGGEKHDAKIEDVRVVCHAAEVALGILYFPIYAPKRVAMADARALLEEFEE